MLVSLSIKEKQSDLNGEMTHFDFIIYNLRTLQNL